MSINDILTSILQLIAGFGVFLIACEMMSENLEAISSNKLKKMFEKVSGNKLVGVSIGAAATAAIQSSSATTVMVIGFVNAGIISLGQAATIIFGGEIGTTITGQIVALGMLKSSGISTTVLFSTFAGIGAFITLIAKKDKTKKIAGILTGFGLLFIGISMMSKSMSSFASSEGLKIFLAGIDNITVLIFLGAILTAIIQSSSAMTSIAIAMVVTGLISLEQGIYITLGANVGTCVTGMLAGMSSTNINAKRTALIQLIFNIGGVVLVAIMDVIMKGLSGNMVSFGIIFAKMFPAIPSTQLAMFHTIFNIASVLLVLPISDYLVDLTKMIIKDEPVIDNPQKEHFYYIDEHMLTTPAIAIQQIKKEIINMSKIANENFNIAMNIIVSMNYFDEEKFRRNEKELNYINHHILPYIIQLTKGNISEEDNTYLTTTYRTVSDLERIGDYSENIIEYADQLKESEEMFSEQAQKEIKMMQTLINELYTTTMKVYTNENDRVSFELSQKREKMIDELAKKMSDNHIERLNEGICTPNVGAQYLKLANDTERIADHLININRKAIELSK